MTTPICSSAMAGVVQTMLVALYVRVQKECIFIYKVNETITEYTSKI